MELKTETSKDGGTNTHEMNRNDDDDHDDKRLSVCHHRPWVLYIACFTECTQSTFAIALVITLL